MRRHLVIFHLTALIFGFSPIFAIDLDEDGLSDVWEAVYSAQNASPNGDPDRDGFTNLEESTLGTDPFDRNSTFSIRPGRTAWNDGAIVWTPQPGKAYRPRLKSEIPNPWSQVSFVTGGGPSEMKIAFCDGKVTGAEGAVYRQIWSPVIGNTLDSTLFDRSEPTMSVFQADLQTPAGNGELYAARITGFITPPESGAYRFWLSSRQESIFKMGPSAANADNIIASVEGIDIEPEVYDASPTQQSTPVSLVAGQEHAFEIQHISGVGLDHMSVVWQGPGMSSPQPIPASALSMRLPTPVPILSGDPSGFFGQLGVEDLDTDGDGVFDWEEYQAGTSPFDPTSGTRGTPLPVSDLVTVGNLYDLYDVIDVGFVRSGNPISTAREGTTGIRLQATRDYAISVDTVIPFNHVGLATNGEDYEFPTNQIVIPGGQLTASIPLTLKTDGVAEGNERLNLLAQTNFDFISVGLTIRD